MTYHYDGLWRMLAERNISKDQLIKRLRLSSATMAKMSAGRAVGLDVLGRICDELHCTSNDILMIEPDDLPWQWQRIDKDTYYSLRIYFIIPFSRDGDNASAYYLYGHAEPVKNSSESSRWRVDPIKGDGFQHDFWLLTGTVTGRELNAFLSGAMAKLPLKDIIQDFAEILFVDERDSKRKQHIIHALGAALVCNGKFVYRPEFLQPRDNICRSVISRYKPLISPDDGAVYCESLFGVGKKDLYLETKGDRSPYAVLIWHCLKQFFKQWNLNEICRLANFELLTPLSGNNAVDITVDKELGENQRPVGAHGITVRIDHHKLRGKFLLRVELGNTRNPIIDNVYQVNCDERSDGIKKITVGENISWVAVYVWQLNSETEMRSSLVFQTKFSLMRRISFQLSVKECDFNLRSAWNKALKRPSKTEPYHVAHYSSLATTEIGGEDDEIWNRIEPQIQEYYFDLLGDPDEPYAGESRFFPEADGKGRADDFVQWLKNLLDHQRTRRIGVKQIILLDPFIDAEALEKLIVSISDTHIIYDVVTDAYPAHKKKEESDKRIDSIRRLEKILDLTTPANFQVKAIKKKGTLHDRFVIMLTDRGVPLVYSLSNSLDGMAGRHASVAIRCPLRLAREIADYYLAMLEQLYEDQIELLYDSTKKRQQMTRRSVADDAIVTDYKDFVDKYRQDAKVAFNSLAYMVGEEKEKCKKYIMAQDEADTKTILIDMLMNASPDTFIRHNDELRVLSICQSLQQDGFDASGGLLEYFETALNYYFDLHNVTDDWSIYYAAKLLWQIDRRTFAQEFVTLASIIKESDAHTTKITPKQIVIFTMASVMITALAYPKPNAVDLGGLIDSDLPWLRALSVGSLFHFPASLNNLQELIKPELPEDAETYVTDTCATIGNGLPPHEAWLSLIFFMRKMQIKIQQCPTAQNKIQKLIDYIADQAVAIFLKQSDKEKVNAIGLLPKELQILNYRGVKDTCRILLLLFREKSLSETKCIQYLVELCLSIYETVDGKEKNYYRVDDIEAGLDVLNYLAELGDDAVDKLRLEMQRQERRLCAQLGNTYLRSQDYNRWKNSIDKLSCFVALEHHIAIEYQNKFPSGVGVKAFDDVTSNAVSQLEKYSEVYVYAKKKEQERERM